MRPYHGLFLLHNGSRGLVWGSYCGHKGKEMSAWRGGEKLNVWQRKKRLESSIQHF